MEECPSRENFDRYMYKVAEQNVSPMDSVKPCLPPSSSTQHDTVEEDWDHVI